MRFSIHTFLIALLVALAGCSAPTKQVIVTYPNNTPASIIEQAMEAIREAGGVITHEYNTLIKGFAAKAPAKVLETVQTMGYSNNVVIEEDQIVNIDNS